MLSAFHRDTTVQDIKNCHPKMATVFNHVSKNENFNHTLETIDKYKTLLTSESIEFYTDFISDDT